MRPPSRENFTAAVRTERLAAAAVTTATMSKLPRGVPLNTGTLVPVASASVGQAAPVAVQKSLRTKVPSVMPRLRPVEPMAVGPATATASAR